MNKFTPLDDVQRREGQPPNELALTGNLYEQLYHIATKLMRREPSECSLQSTILVHDAFLTLQRQRNLTASNRSVLLAAAAKIMRRLLIDCARAKFRLKRGKNRTRESLPASVADDAKTIDMIELHDALEALRRHCELSADIVELKFFGGMSHKEIACVKGKSERTVGEKWRFAKAWLYREIFTENIKESP